MQIDHYFILASILLGIGLSGALARRNLVAVIMSLIVAGLGALLSVFTVIVGQSPDKARTDGFLFGFCMELVLFFWIILGCALVYRRYVASGSSWLNQKNNLIN